MGSIQVTGLNEIAIELKSESVEAIVRARAAIQTTSKKVKDTAKTFVPVDSGELRDSITYETRLLASSAVGEIGPTVLHGMFMEWGTYKDPPQAFMGPALDRHSHELERALLDGLIV